MIPLSPDTQATALLVARLGPLQPGVQPLTRPDYNRLAQALHQRALRPADLFTAIPTGLPIDTARLTALIARGTALALALDAWARLGIGIVARGDASYPARFRTHLKAAAAPILYVAGNPALLERPTLGIVGSRDATAAGLDFARRCGERAAHEGVVLVSGDARGIDRTAMEAALDAGGSVIGILADSLARSVLSKRYRQAAASGHLLLLSPFDPAARFQIGQAMERNRYIYAASDAAIVVDSDVKGGTWTGALENQKHRWAPAYVRIDQTPRDGNLALAKAGLLELDQSWCDGATPIAALFEPARPEPARPEPALAPLPLFA